MKINFKKLLKRSIVVILILTLIGYYFANKFVKSYGFSGVSDFISNYWHNSSLADKVEPENLTIHLKDEDYNFLKERRDKAIERGIQINDGDDNYVPCELELNGEKIEAEIRLKGHMTDHLEGDTWSFRVKMKDGELWGMNRFSLQKPGTRNYAYEWVYHQLLKNEEVINLNYNFIHLNLNDKDLGIYAVEEHFGQHVLEHNNRPEGAILRWNPNLYWEWRIDELQGTYLNQQYSDFSSSIVEPYEKGTVEKSETLTNTYIKAAEKLESFRRGEKKTSEVFDVLKMARFHAIIDLVGGHHSLDWSDVKFFYNSETDMIEPVGYESFSVRKTEHIAGQRLPDLYDQPDLNYHNLLFSDPEFFKVYIQELERIANEKYLKKFIEKIQSELDEKIGILSHEFPYIKFSFDPYFENIELIRHNLELPKPFHAFIDEFSDTLIQLQVSPVSDYPIEILSLEIDEKFELKPIHSTVLPAKARNTFGHYFIVQFTGDYKKLKNLKVKARIPGSKNIFNVEVFELPSFLKSKAPQIKLQLDSQPSYIHYLNDSVLYFSEKNVKIADEIFISKGQSLKIFPGQNIAFVDQGQLICEGNISAFGLDEEENTIVFSSEQLGQSAIIINGGTFYAQDCLFANFNGGIENYQSKVRFKAVEFSQCTTPIFNSNLSDISLINCVGGELNSLGVFNQSLIRIDNLFVSQGDTLLLSNASDIDMRRSFISNYKVLASLNHNSSFNTWHVDLKNLELLFECNQASSFRLIGGELININQAVLKNSSELKLPGEVAYEFYRVDLSGVKKVE